MKHKSDRIMPRGQLGLRLEAPTRFDESTRKNAVQLLSALLLSAAKAGESAAETTAKEARDEDRRSS